MDKQMRDKIYQLALPLSDYHTIKFKGFVEALNLLVNDKCDACWHKYRPKKLFTVEDDGAMLRVEHNEDGEIVSAVSVLPDGTVEDEPYVEPDLDRALYPEDYFETAPPQEEE